MNNALFYAFEFKTCIVTPHNWLVWVVRLIKQPTADKSRGVNSVRCIYDAKSRNNDLVFQQAWLNATWQCCHCLYVSLKYWNKHVSNLHITHCKYTCVGLHCTINWRWTQILHSLVHCLDMNCGQVTSCFSKVFGHVRGNQTKTRMIGWQLVPPTMQAMAASCS